jgi:hypothetical protein
MPTLIEYEGAPHGLFAAHKERLSADLLEFVGTCLAGHSRRSAAA